MNDMNGVPPIHDLLTLNPHIATNIIMNVNGAGYIYEQ